MATTNINKKESFSIRERISDFLYWDTGKCEWCRESHDGAISLTYSRKISIRGHTLPTLLPHMKKFCSPECVKSWIHHNFNLGD